MNDFSDEAVAEVQRLADNLHASHIAQHALLTVAEQPGFRNLIPERLPGQLVPLGTIERDIEYHLPHYLDQALDPSFRTTATQVWLAGSFIALGDALAAHGYFDRSPELEVVRHLRNAAAHGNRFRIDDPARLDSYPAHIAIGPRVFTITPELHDERLFPDTLGERESLSLLGRVNRHLGNLRACNA